MDQGLKERLVGAAVLVAIGVWLIPWVLDGPDNTVETGPASLQLPAAEEPVPMRTQTLRVDEPEAVAPPTPQAAEPSEAETVVAAASPAAEPPPVTKPAPAPAPKAAEAPPVKPAAPVAAKPAPATAAKGDWVVQLGVFGEEANARRLAQKVNTFGYKPAVSSYVANGKTLYRVRVGAYDVKSQAEATASALTAHGLTAKVVPAN
jgi:DedD protein